jgi:hypothetical protein
MKATEAPYYNSQKWFDLIYCAKATFGNISAISWRPVLVVEEAVVPGENHRPWASNWSTSSLAAASRVQPFMWFTKPGANPCHIGDRLVWVVRLSNYLTHWATRALVRNGIYLINDWLLINIRFISLSKELHFLKRYYITITLCVYTQVFFPKIN